MTFGAKKRFELKEDETIVARAGVQSNCAGIAEIHVCIVYTENAGIAFFPMKEGCSSKESDLIIVPAIEMPSVYRIAVFKGAQQAYEESGLTVGIKLTLIDALVHPVDANERKFIEAGHIALAGWINHKHNYR